MTEQQRLKNLQVPEGCVDVVLDTDAFNEVDDQYAIAYLLGSKEKLNTVAIYAAPFTNSKSKGPQEGMEKSYHEIFKILELLGEEEMKKNVFKGSESYLPSETEAVVSPAALDLCERAEKYSPENPLYVVALGAITNVASALVLKPEIKENIVVVWLGGHGHNFPKTDEFNMRQDIAGVRVVMGCGVPFVRLPCKGVVSAFRISRPELEEWLLGKSELADYLTTITIREAQRYTDSEIWTRVIWDVTAVAWLLNDGERFMNGEIKKTPIVEYDSTYVEDEKGHLMNYIYYVSRDTLMRDFIKKIAL